MKECVPINCSKSHLRLTKIFLVVIVSRVAISDMLATYCGGPLTM